MSMVNRRHEKGIKKQGIYSTFSNDNTIVAVREAAGTDCQISSELLLTSLLTVICTNFLELIMLVSQRI